jgi:hypothetical protein
MSNRSLQISLPTGPVAPLPAEGKSAVRPLAGPVMPLTVTPGNSDELMGGSGTSPVHGDAIATSVLVKGEPVPAPTGRADDFVWRPGNEGTAALAAVPVNTPPVSEPAAESDKRPLDTKRGAAAGKNAQSGPAKSKSRDDDNRRSQQNNAPRPPQPIKPSGPLGWLR